MAEAYPEFQTQSWSLSSGSDAWYGVCWDGVSSDPWHAWRGSYSQSQWRYSPDYDDNDGNKFDQPNSSWSDCEHEGDPHYGAVASCASTASPEVWDDDTRGRDKSAACAFATNFVIPKAITNETRYVLVLGMPKCGTTSLQEAFKSAGFNSVHWALKAGVDLHADVQLRKYGEDADQRLVAKLMYHAVRHGFKPLDYLPLGVNAVAEMNGLVWENSSVWGYFPQMSLLDKLVECYPDAYFVLNVRDHWRWVKSVSKQNDLRQRLVAADLPRLPPGAGARDEELVEWVAAHHACVRALLSRPRYRFLEFDIERHGEKELSSFLGCKVEWAKHNVSW